jgi:ABC-type transport system involved in cytochrome bd biosynthesis fused ATPase/permease subunit
MLIIPPPRTNAQRQAAFQASHPGYDRRRIARKRAAAKRGAALLLAEITAKLAAEAEATSQAVTLANKPPLLLPAPVRDETIAAIESLALFREISTAKVALPRE